MRTSSGRDTRLGAVLPVVAAIAAVAWVPTAARATHGVTCFGKSATIVGTAGPDHLTGTDHRDVIAGLGGDDVIKGLGGADLICGDAGDDVIDGGGGRHGVDSEGVYYSRELLSGGAGTDLIHGGPGADFLGGGAGNDRLLGGPGADELFGGQGNDRLDGGTSRDSLDGGPGADVGVGGAGSDRVYEQEADDPDADVYRLGAGNDDTGRLRGDNRVYGGHGHDRIGGSPGNDLLDGGPGNDTLTGAAGDDRLIGGDGRDTAHFPGPSSESASLVVDLAAGTATGAGTDQLHGVEDVAAGFGPNVLLGDAEPNRFTESAAQGDAVKPDVVRGRGGRDTFRYNEPHGPGCPTRIDLRRQVATCTDYGHDQPTATTRLHSVENATGGSENDTLIGDSGKNVLRGDKGADHLSGNGGDDELYGGDQYFRHEKHAADHLDGGAGTDVCHDPDANTVYRRCER